MTLFYNNISFLSPLPLPESRLKRLTRRLFATIAGQESEEKLREENFRNVMEEYSSVIAGICFSYATDSDDLKDLRQDIMINIWKGLKTYRGESSLSTWIYRVALNTCVSTVRRRSRRPSTIPLDASPDAAEETDTDSRERIETLHSLISTLSPLDKAVMTMWLDERRYEEIAEVTGISRNNVAVRINRIKQKLAEKFTKYAES